MGRLHKADDRPDGGSSSHSLHSIDPADELPPPYTDEPEITAASTSAVPPALPRAPAALQLIDSAYALPDTAGHKPSDRQVFSTAPALSTNSSLLFTTARRQVVIPPRPLLYVKGTHTETRHNGNKKENSTVTDFDFKLDLAETLLTGWENDGSLDTMWRDVNIISDDNPIPAYRGGRFRTDKYKAPNSGAIALPTDGEDAEALLAPDTMNFPMTKPMKDLEKWCKRFCDDPAPVKSFTIHRDIRGFDENAMRNVISSHIRSLNYLGQIACQMCISRKSVTIYSPHWINRMRANKYIWWIFVVLQLWIITWPIIFFLERRYEVAHIVWHAALDPGTDSGLIKCYARGRDMGTLAEYWGPAVKQAAWSRRRGEGNTLTRLDADRLQGMNNEQILGLQRQGDSDAEIERRARVDRGEGGFMDSVVGLVRGVGEVHQDWRRAAGWGANT